MKLINLIIIALLFGCNEPAKKPDKKEPLLDKAQIEFLQAKFDRYKELSKDRLDEKGWIQDTKCDGLLFQSLYSLATGISDPYASEDDKISGKYYRHWTHSCYQNHVQGIPNGSSSETSRDMFIGLFSFLLQDQSKDRFKSIIAFAEKNKWVMGKADKLGAVEFRPDLIAHTYQIEHFFGLGNNVNRGLVPLDYSTCKDFACHLRALLIWQRHTMGLYNERDRKALLAIRDIDERNALFYALYAKFQNDRRSAQKAYNVLVGEYFPSDRLPTSKEKCGFYIWEREPTSSAWEPCPERKPDQVWSGIDFLIATYILLEE